MQPTGLACNCKLGDAHGSRRGPRVRLAYCTDQRLGYMVLTISRPDLTTTLRVIVGTGEAQKTFIVYKNVLCAGSSFFRAYCSERWQERDNDTIRLPNDDPKIAKIYLEWLVTGNLSEYFQIGHPVIEEEPHRLYTLAATLYVFGDCVDDTDFKNALVNETFSIADRTKTFPVKIPSFVYENTTLKCPYRRLVVDLWVTFARCRAVEEHANDLPREFLVDVVARMASFQGLLPRFTTEQGLFAAGLCAYHDHEPNKPAQSAPHTPT